MITYERAVRFEEVDAAGIVFFARFFGYCHEAMETIFRDLPGGYVDIVVRRRVGFPAVHAAADWKVPLRYGDSARIEVSVLKLGTTSCTLRYELFRVADSAHAATIEHVVVVSNLDTLTKIPIPDDIRAALEAHLVR